MRAAGTRVGILQEQCCFQEVLLNERQVKFRSHLNSQRNYVQLQDCALSFKMVPAYLLCVKKLGVLCADMVSVKVAVTTQILQMHGLVYNSLSCIS